MPSQPSGRCVDAVRTHARVFGSQPPQDVTGRVGGPIVDDDELECDVPLREEMTNRCFEARLLIPRGDDHRAAHGAGRPAVQFCRRGQRLERRQPPRPSLVPEGNQ